MSVSEDEGRSGGWVKIDRQFVRDQAGKAVRQFFTPLVAPFQMSGATSTTGAPPTATRRKRA